MKKSIIFLKSTINLILDILLPTRCVLCHTQGEILCSNCITNLPQTDRQTEDNIRAVFDYQSETVKKLIWKTKYYHSKILGRKLGKLLHYSLLEDITEIKIFSEGSPIYIIPVPITKMKKNIRGYNQSEVIASGFCEEDKNNIFQIQNNIIYKKINTIPQAKIPNRNERLKNIRGSFEIKNQNLIVGKTIIVIDDVTTTGATMQEIIKILTKYGAKKVIGFAVAH